MRFLPIFTLIVLILTWAFGTELSRNEMFLIAVTGWLCVVIGDVIRKNDENLDGERD